VSGFSIILKVPRKTSTETNLTQIQTLSSAIKCIFPTSSAALEYTSERNPVTDLTEKYL
jgi:hypothetical protein